MVFIEDVSRMKNIVLLSFLFFVSWNLDAMQENNLIGRLRNTPMGKHIMLCNSPWVVEENSLFLSGTGKAVLLHKTEICGKTVHESRRTIEIGLSPHSGKLNFTHIRSGRETNWGILMNGSLFVGFAALLGATLLFGRN